MSDQYKEIRSKLRKYIENNDELGAINLVNEPNITNVDLNVNIPVNYKSINTFMHLAAEKGMKSLLKLLLNQRHGNGNYRNKNKQTILHKACEGVDDQTQVECINVLVEWQDILTKHKIDINAVDQDGNSALNYAVKNNLQKCIQTLIERGADLLIENKEGHGLYNVAKNSGQIGLACFIESKIFFKNNDKTDENENIDIIIEPKYGYTIDDLQAKKDNLLAEIISILQCSLLSAEILLKKHFWSKDYLIETWLEDPIECCKKCGLDIPPNLLPDTVAEDLLLETKSQNSNLEHQCTICLEQIDENQSVLECSHKFCKLCIKQYLTYKIQEGKIRIFCPEVDCTTIIPSFIIEKLLPYDVFCKYNTFSFNEFIQTNPSLKWCPYPDCGRLIRCPVYDVSNYAKSNGNNQKDFSRSVDCGNGHRCCWECLEEEHEPTSCSDWKKWFENVKIIQNEDVDSVLKANEYTANNLWLTSKSKKCPNISCNVPIEKNEGCNHMVCTECEHEFCWVCLIKWEDHTDTCVEKSAELSDLENEQIAEAQKAYDAVHEKAAIANINLRCMNQLHNIEKESSLYETLQTRYERLVDLTTKYPGLSLIDYNDSEESKIKESELNSQLESKNNEASTKIDLPTKNFIANALEELHRSRKILRSSYIYSYYTDAKTTTEQKIIQQLIETKRKAVQAIMSELEKHTNNLSNVISGEYFKASHYKIIKTTGLIKYKRLELLKRISTEIFVPNKFARANNITSDNLESVLSQYENEDDEFKQTLLLSLSQPISNEFFNEF